MPVDLREEEELSKQQIADMYTKIVCVLIKTLPESFAISEVLWKADQYVDGILKGIKEHS